MTQRQKLILIAVIKEYIKNAQPVGSKLIFEKYDFDISPATYRNEFSALEEMGYLYQPHTSAGRVPTDKGYRFFVNYLLEKKAREKERLQKMFWELLEEKKRQDEIFYELAKKVSDLSKNAVLSGSLQKSIFFKSGIHQVLSQPEFDDISVRKEFGSLIDSFDERVQDILEKISDEDTLVFIGNENPFDRAKDFSLILSKCRFYGSDGIIAILGPKRMDYTKNLEIINSLKTLFK